MHLQHQIEGIGGDVSSAANRSQKRASTAPIGAQVKHDISNQKRSETKAFKLTRPPSEELYSRNRLDSLLGEVDSLFDFNVTFSRHSEVGVKVIYPLLVGALWWSVWLCSEACRFESVAPADNSRRNGTLVFCHICHQVNPCTVGEHGMPPFAEVETKITLDKKTGVEEADVLLCTEPPNHWKDSVPDIPVWEPGSSPSVETAPDCTSKEEVVRLLRYEKLPSFLAFVDEWKASSLVLQQLLFAEDSGNSDQGNIQNTATVLKSHCRFILEELKSATCNLSRILENASQQPTKRRQRPDGDSEFTATKKPAFSDTPRRKSVCNLCGSREAPMWVDDDTEEPIVIDDVDDQAAAVEKPEFVSKQTSRDETSAINKDHLRNKTDSKPQATSPATAKSLPPRTKKRLLDEKVEGMSPITSTKKIRIKPREKLTTASEDTNSTASSSNSKQVPPREMASITAIFCKWHGDVTPVSTYRKQPSRFICPQCDTAVEPFRNFVERHEWTLDSIYMDDVLRQWVCIARCSRMHRILLKTPDLTGWKACKYCLPTTRPSDSYYQANQRVIFDNARVNLQRAEASRIKRVKAGQSAVFSDPGDFDGSCAIKSLMALRSHANPWHILNLQTPPKRRISKNDKQFLDARARYKEWVKKVHPDKNKHPDAQEAFHILDKAWKQIEANAVN